MTSTSVEPVTDEQGLRMNHPDLEVYVRNGIKLGWGNEQICKVVGVPASFVDKVRDRLRKDTNQR